MVGTVAYSPPPGQQHYGQQQPYPPYQGAYSPYPPPARTNGLAVAALVCGIATFVVGLTFVPAIICGHLARRQIRRTGERGDGMALGGLILGYVGGALIIVGVVLSLVVLGASTSVSDSYGSPRPAVGPVQVLPFMGPAHGKRAVAPARMKPTLAIIPAKPAPGAAKPTIQLVGGN